MTLRPPSTARVCPVMKEAPLPARNSIALATFNVQVYSVFLKTLFKICLNYTFKEYYTTLSQIFSNAILISNSYPWFSFSSSL